MYYDLKEAELRQIERIEEGFLRKVLKTTMGCPITQLYLEMGVAPARFEIQKMRLLYLKNILEDNEESSRKKFFFLQLELPTRGSWAQTCINDMKDLRITETFEEIKLMTKYKFNSILKERIKKNALKYLLDKKGKKGKEIIYSELQMAEYLLPGSNNLTIEEKCKIFAVKNRMIDIPANFGGTNTCICGMEEDMAHIYNCGIYKGKQPILVYEKIFSGNIREQIEIFRLFEQNFEERLKNKTEIPM